MSRLFHFSDVLTATTGRLVSTRHMDGVYDMYNFLTGDSLYTHQLPRAARECEPWIAAQFPQLMKSTPAMDALLCALDARLAASTDIQRKAVLAAWLEEARIAFGLPEMIAVYEMGDASADLHTRIDPIEEARAMMGAKRVLAITVGGESR